MESKTVLEIIQAKSAEVARVASRDPTPNLERFKERKSIISVIGAFINNINTALETLKKDYNNLKTLHADETNTIKHLLDDMPAKAVIVSAPTPLPVPEQSDWITVAKKQRKAPMIQNTSGKKSHIIKPGIVLNAISVDNFDQVKSDGELYYVTPNEHFAIKIAGILFHGNIGVIYTEEPILARTTDCKYIKGCTRPSCEFYHDPVVFPQSNDIRNYHNSSFSYSPAKDKKYGHSRHFGSFPNLHSDLEEVTAQGAIFMRDQAFHELLSALIATEYAS